MTYEELYTQVKMLLQTGGCDSPAFEARCLLTDFGYATPAQVQKVLAAANRRAAGEPLQYLLGTWDFLNLTLEVGEGVLIPRPDTELLCETAAARLSGSPRVLDLCAGSGCVGLGVASLYPSAEVTAIELSAAAFSFLTRNAARYPQYKVSPVQADITVDAARFEGRYQAILSNPPYIPTAELSTLMREVQHEPKMALDGGDGFAFYRVIAEQWVNKLEKGGFCAVEVGLGQAQTVATLLMRAGLSQPEIFKDAAGIERVVICTAI